jgi:hypothetical protein
MHTHRLAAGAVAAVLAGCASFSPGRGAYSQTYFPASHNWTFRRLYPETDRLFNGFDYGHAILYQTLLTGGSGQTLDTRTFDHVTRDVLRHPPDVPLEERAIGPDYVQLVPEIVAMFDWAHMLHRQLYDVLSDERISATQQAGRVQQLIAYYRSRPDLALSARPKGMDLMEGQPYSLTFRRDAPKYNALIWSYHWLQMVSYDALLTADDRPARTAALHRAVERFWEMNDGAAPGPSVMPMSAAIAPRFTGQYPEAAAIFDNLHSLHDVVSDILSSRGMSSRDKRAAALTAAAHYRDDVTDVMALEDWKQMSVDMDVAKMGGTLPGVPR